MAAISSSMSYDSLKFCSVKSAVKQNHSFRVLIFAHQTPSSSSSSSSSGGKKKKTSLDVACSNPAAGRKNSVLLTKKNNAAALADLVKCEEIPIVEFDEGGENLGKIVPDLKDGERSLVKSQAFFKGFDFPSRKFVGIVVLNVLTVIYASNIPVVKETEAILDPSLFSVARFSVATIPFIPFMFQTWRDSRTCIAGVELGLWVSAGYLMQSIGLLTSDAGRAAFISALTVIVVPLLDGFLGTRIPKITWFGAIVALIGIALLESSGSPVTIGDFWNLLSAIFFGIHMLRTEHISRNTSRDKYLGLLGYEIFVIALVSAIWYWWSNDTSNLYNMNMEDVNLIESWRKLVALPWLPIIYTGIFSTGFCLWAELAAMRDVSATDAAIIYGLEPLWGAAFAWFLLGERWGPTGWFGALLILGGSFTVQLFGSSPEKSSISSSTSQTESKESSPQVDCENKPCETRHTLNSDVKKRTGSKASKHFK